MPPRWKQVHGASRGWSSTFREVLDATTGEWGIRVNRVEIKAIHLSTSVEEAMEKEMWAERGQACRDTARRLVETRSRRTS